MTQEEKKLPEGLKEAAENYIAPIENDEGLDYINFNGRDIRDAFIAGAEWMAAQGECVEFYVEETDGLPSCYMRLPGGVAGTYCLNEKVFKDGDTVIVQIRKK